MGPIGPEHELYTATKMRSFVTPCQMPPPGYYWCAGFVTGIDEFTIVEVEKDGEVTVLGNDELYDWQGIRDGSVFIGPIALPTDEHILKE
jgi:hypothetical protein